MALGMFEHATYAAGRTLLDAGDVLVMYSDGITEAEDGQGQPFDEVGRAADRRSAGLGVGEGARLGDVRGGRAPHARSAGCSTT